MRKQHILRLAWKYASPARKSTAKYAIALGFAGTAWRDSSWILESLSPKGVDDSVRWAAQNAGQVSELARVTAVAATRRSSQTQVFIAKTAVNVAIDYSLTIAIQVF